MDFILSLIPPLLLGIVAGGIILLYLKKQKNLNLDKQREEVNQLKISLGTKELELNDSQKKIEVLEARLTDFEEFKKDKIETDIAFKNIEIEKNKLKEENTSLKKDEDIRINESKKAIDSANILINSVEKEKER